MDGYKENVSRAIIYIYFFTNFNNILYLSFLSQPFFKFSLWVVPFSSSLPMSMSASSLLHFHTYISSSVHV